MKNKLSKSAKIKALVSFLAMPKSRENLDIVLENLLTSSEITKIYDRIRILDCLERGLSQRETQERVGGGIATISRGADMVKAPKFNIFAGILAEARLQSWWNTLFWRK